MPKFALEPFCMATYGDELCRYRLNQALGDLQERLSSCSSPGQRPIDTYSRL